MSKHQETGQLGEKLALEHLEAAGYTILEKGYRYKRVELDLIAKDGDCLVFVEVKARRGTGYGHPSLAVSESKERNMARAARAYMRAIDHTWAVRFDIIAVVLAADDTYELEHLKDAFFPGVW